MIFSKVHINPFMVHIVIIATEGTVVVRCFFHGWWSGQGDGGTKSYLGNTQWWLMMVVDVADVPK